MANGKFHAASTIILSVASLAALPYGSTAWVSAGIALGVILTPDLDIASSTYSKRIMKNALSIFGYIWFWFWYPYGKLMSHRSFFSHAPVVGTVIRCVYLLAPFWILSPSTAEALMYEYSSILSALFLGLCLSDSLHLAVDIASTSLKRIF